MYGSPLTARIEFPGGLLCSKFGYWNLDIELKWGREYVEHLDGTAPQLDGSATPWNPGPHNKGYFKNKDSKRRYSELTNDTKQWRMMAYIMKKIFPATDGTGYKKISTAAGKGYSKRTPQEWAELIASKLYGLSGNERSARGFTAVRYSNGELKKEVQTA